LALSTVRDIEQVRSDSSIDTSKAHGHSRSDASCRPIAENFPRYLINKFDGASLTDTCYVSQTWRRSFWLEKLVDTGTRNAWRMRTKRNGK